MSVTTLAYRALAILSGNLELEKLKAYEVRRDEKLKAYGIRIDKTKSKLKSS